MKKTHYLENGKTLCGLASIGIIIVKTREGWYASSHKCKRCQKGIATRSIIQ